VLCAKAVLANDSEVEAILIELRAALREHTEYVRQMASKAFTHSYLPKAA